MAFDLLKPASVDKSLCTEIISMLLEDLPVLVKILLGNEPCENPRTNFDLDINR